MPGNTLARTFTQTARPPLMARRGQCRGQRGRSPPPASAGDSRSVAPRGTLLNNETGVREARGGRFCDPAPATAEAVAEHLRERFGEPVQTDLAKRGRRWDGG